MKISNNKGFAHFAALAIVVLAVASFGTYKLVASNAQTLSSESAGASTCAGTRPRLSNGSVDAQPNNCVSYLQNKLNAMTNAGLVPDGKFGPKTKTAVINIQAKNGLNTDGIVGKCTWGAILNSKLETSCKTGGVTSRNVAKPKPIDTSKIYCTYRDSADRTLVKNAPMTRTQCKALGGSSATSIPVSCTYNILKNTKLVKTIVNSANPAACEKQKYNNEIGICTAKVGSNTEDQRVTHARCDGYNKKSPGIATWKGPVA